VERGFTRLPTSAIFGNFYIVGNFSDQRLSMDKSLGLPDLLRGPRCPLRFEVLVSDHGDDGNLGDPFLIRARPRKSAVMPAF
jgi:hypothetical protein